LMKRLFSLIWLFSIPLSFLSPSALADTPEAKILVNQAGYDLDGPKRVLLQSNFDPREIHFYEITQGSAAFSQREWGETQYLDAWNLWYREANLPDLPAGEYRLLARWQGQTVESPPVWIGTRRLSGRTGPLAAYFFYAQRCGAEVKGWHGPCHLDDARMRDGSHRDLSGGWHDAGDYNKYNGYTPLSVYALARFAMSPASRTADWPRDQPGPVEEAMWGARWLQKCQDPAAKKIIGRVYSGVRFWGRPEDETDQIPGNGDDRPVDVYDWNENEMTVAAWSALYRSTGDPAWRVLALGLWDVVEAYDLGFDLAMRAKRLLAAVELFRATGDQRFLIDSQNQATVILARQESDGAWPLWIMALVDYGIIASALAEFALAFPWSELASSVRNSLRRYLDFWESRMVQPFGIPQWSGQDIFYPPLQDEWYVGQNSMYLSQAWAGLLISRVLGREESRARPWASGCLDWVLGVNPFGICLMNEAGSVHLPKNHHRYDRIPNGKNGIVPGAVLNGIIRLDSAHDLPYLDLLGNGWRTNEPWLPHNAYFLLALSEWDQKKSRSPF